MRVVFDQIYLELFAIAIQKAIDDCIRRKYHTQDEINFLLESSRRELVEKCDNDTHWALNVLRQINQTQKTT